MTNVNETLVHEGITYRKANREAEVGEKVLTVKYRGSNTRPGEVLTVTEANYLDGSIQTDKRAFFDTEYDKYVVLEPIAETDPLTQSDDLFVTEADVRNNPRQVIDLIANLAGRLTKLESKVERLGDSTEQAISTVARNVETWAQEHENLKHELAKVDERTQPYQQLHDVMVETAKALNKARPLTAEERREL
jgi:hypothetical protein